MDTYTDEAGVECCDNCGTPIDECTCCCVACGDGVMECACDAGSTWEM